jgi:hypothetical protein
METVLLYSYINKTHKNVQPHTVKALAKENELPKQLEDVPLATRIAMYFQHDGVLSH